MIYKPKELWNPTDHVVEVISGGEHFIFKPQEKQILEGFVAYQILVNQNSPLEEYTGKEKATEMLVGDDNMLLQNLGWLQLRKVAIEKGVFERKMKKKDILKALLLLDDKKKL